jgi:hypothetical protein
MPHRAMQTTPKNLQNTSTATFQVVVIGRKIVVFGRAKRIDPQLSFRHTPDELKELNASVSSAQIRGKRLPDGIRKRRRISSHQESQGRRSKQRSSELVKSIRDAEAKLP